MSPNEERELMRRLVAEVAQLEAGYQIPLFVTPQAALLLVANLQLALRHPGNRGPSARLARATIDGLIERLRAGGFTAHAEAAALGYDPAHDFEGTGKQ